MSVQCAAYDPLVQVPLVAGGDVGPDRGGRGAGTGVGDSMTVSSPGGEDGALDFQQVAQLRNGRATLLAGGDPVHIGAGPLGDDGQELQLAVVAMRRTSTAGEPSTVTAGLWPAAPVRPDHLSSRWRLSGRFCVRRTVTCYS